MEALNTENKQLIDTETLRAVKLSDVPANALLINSTMVLRKKPDKLKEQIADIYSPTIGALSYSIVHQVAIIDRMHVRIIDTVGAYLYQTYPSSLLAIYIKMPVKVMETCKIPSNIVYRIEKYIYGLPDSGRAYYLAYSTLLLNSGYTKSKSGPCLFLKFYPDSGDRIYIWVNVDDTFTAATSIWLLDEFETVVKSLFKITVKSDVDLYLGIHFDYLPNGACKNHAAKAIARVVRRI